MNTFGLSSHEYMARQVNYTQGLNLPASHYRFHTVRPITVPLTGQRNTAVMISPVRAAGARFHGTREFKYWRTDLASISNKTFKLTPGYVPTTKAQLLQFINAELGMTLTVDDIVDAPIASFATPHVETFQISPTSLLYKGTFTATFTYALEQALPTRVLDGFVYPDTQTTQVATDVILSYLTQAQNQYVASDAEKNDEALGYIAHARDEALEKHYFDFGAVLQNTDRTATLLAGYRTTLTIHTSDDVEDTKLFLKANGNGLDGPGWYSAFNDSSAILVGITPPDTLARGLIVLSKTGNLVTLTLELKPLKAIWMPTITVTLSTVLN